jgi:hypothetical protein
VTLRSLSGWSARPTTDTDVYRDYFALRALERAGLSAPARALRTRLAEARRVPGTDDVWARVGGRLYTTSFAMLALK